MVGVPTALICMMVSGIFWGSFVGNKIYTELPANVEEIKDDGKDLPPFGLVLGVILIPLVLILLSTLSKYMPLPEGVKDVLGFIGKPFLALTIATLASMYFLGIKRGFTGAQLKKILDHSLDDGRYDSSGHCQRWSDPMDASGFRPWKYYRTGAGEEWTSIDPDRISHCPSGQSFCRKFHCSDDNGIRNYGNHAGCNGYQHALQSCYVLCNLWRRNCTEPCE